MCGIVGIISKDPVSEKLLDGLRRLEYRGYDSAGIAVLNHDRLERRRAEGKLRHLEKALMQEPLDGVLGIGHTRWATHGAPNEINAHPHMTEDVAVVHNGIIENFQELRDELSAAGYSFDSETDTETIPILVTHYLSQGNSPREAVQQTLERIDGAFALGVMIRSAPDRLFAARKGSPLAIGIGQDEMYIASDAIALAPLSNRICYLEEGDWAEITRDGMTIFNRANDEVSRPVVTSAVSGAAVGKEGYRHFMLKEIHEQPGVIGETLGAYYHPVTHDVSLPELPFDAKSISRLSIVACGTSYYAGMVAKYWIEQWCRLPVDVDIASEFRYRNPVLPENGLFLCISQSGETADTLAALRLAKEQNQDTIALVNVPESSMAREAEMVLRTYAGPEIGVASTKAFTAQLTVLACLALALAEQRGALAKEESRRLAHALAEIPAVMSQVLAGQEKIAEIAMSLADAQDILYIGRWVSFPIALEGALKLKEISYIHAEAYAAGELKHGPIALIDELVPVIVIAPPDELFEKTASNLQEVVARGGRVILLGGKEGAERLQDYIADAITLPPCHPMLSPLLYALPIQLLAYHVALQKGTDVDQPRNLAKSVTVE